MEIEMKKEVRNTPGIWHVGERLKDIDGNEAISIGAGPDGRTVLRIATVRAPLGNEEAEANARLIAASPKLLDALKVIISAIGPQRASDAGVKIMNQRRLREGLTKALQAQLLTLSAAKRAQLAIWQNKQEPQQQSDYKSG